MSYCPVHWTGASLESQSSCVMSGVLVLNLSQPQTCNLITEIKKLVIIIMMYMAKNSYELEAVSSFYTPVSLWHLVKLHHIHHLASHTQASLAILISFAYST